MAKIDEDSDSLILGGRYAMYNEKVNFFFSELKACGANLVFFCRPFLNSLNEDLILEAFDRVVEKDLDWFQRNQRNKKNLFPWHLDKRFLYNLVNIIAKYGDVYTQLFGTYQRIIEYSSDLSNHVLAMIQHDTDFLLSNGHYQYWSLADLDILNLKTKKYCRENLYQRLRLTTKESQLLSGISRLEGLKDNDHKNFFINLQIPREENANNFFLKIAYYVRTLEIGENEWNEDHLRQIVHDIYGENDQQTHLENLEHELSRFNKPGVEMAESAFVKFCKERLYFAYGLIVEDFSTNQALAYIDLRRENSTSYIDMAITILLKQCGILLKDHEARPKARSIKIKRRIDDEAVSDERDIIYPPSKLKN